MLHEERPYEKKEFIEFSNLYRSASYMSEQYLKSLYKMDMEGIWKVPGSKLRKGNLKKP
jgi:hypothetical protein